VFAAPADLTDRLVLDGLATGWHLEPTACEYAPLGFGSHHWIVDTADGGRWFPTVHDLEAKASSDDEDTGAVMARLRAALQTSRALADAGATYLVAPVPAADGAVVHPIGHRYALSLYPYIDGRSWTWGEFESFSQRLAVLDVVVELHGAPEEARQAARTDDFAICRRDGLLHAMTVLGAPWDGGPYSEVARALLERHAADVVRVLEHYDRLATVAREQPERLVLTHGEPHIGNVMVTDGHFVLIDWDSVLVAPPERDLWILDPGDRSITEAYTGATGRAVLPEMMELYRIAWDLAEVAIYVTEFHGPHIDDRNTQESSTNLHLFFEQIAATSAALAAS